MYLKLGSCFVVVLSLSGCGTTATEFGVKTSSAINRQDQAVDPERGKIVYTSEACDGSTEGVDSSMCAVAVKDKEGKSNGEP